MDSFDRRMRERLMAVTPEWQERAAELKREIKQMYEARMKRAAFWHWTGSGIGAFLILMALPGLALGYITRSPVIAVIAAMVFLLGDGWIGFSKLLYWTWNSRIRLEKEIKETRGDVLELHQKLDRLESSFSQRTNEKNGA